MLTALTDSQFNPIYVSIYVLLHPRQWPMAKQTSSLSGDTHRVVTRDQKVSGSAPVRVASVCTYIYIYTYVYIYGRLKDPLESVEKSM